MTGPLSPNPRQIARRLLSLENPDGSGRGGTAPDGAELQRVCLQITEQLADAMGDDGSAALIARALARTEGEHPVLRSIRTISEGHIELDGVESAVSTHGAAAVASALEALFAALTDILGRFIGEDMAIRLMAPDPRMRARGGPDAS